MRSNTSRFSTRRTMAYPISATPKGAKLNPRAAAEALLAAGPSHLLKPVGTPMADALMAAGEQALAMNPIRLASPAQVEANQQTIYGAFSGTPVNDGLIAAGRISGSGADYEVRDPEPLDGGGVTVSVNDKKSAELAAAGGGGSEAIGFGPQTVQHGPFTLAKSVGTGKPRPKIPPAPVPNPKRRQRTQSGRAPQAADKSVGAGIGSVAQAAAGSGPSFNEKAPWIMSNLQRDFGLTRNQAAGILGNLGHESGGFQHFQEIGSGPRSGGRGWAQWTGPRRVAFLRWARERGVDPRSDYANYGFLRHELMTTERRSLDALRAQETVRGATVAFERSFERAGVKAHGSRLRYAQQALDATRSQTPSNQPQPVYPDGKPEGVE